jgi:hypothetical protein
VVGVNHAAVAARLPVPAQQPAPTTVRQGVEADTLWHILSAGKPGALTAVDWAAAATLLLCRVLLGPHTWCTLHFGVTDATGLFEYHHGTWARCCAQVARGQLWGSCWTTQTITYAIACPCTCSPTAPPLRLCRGLCGPWCK